MATTFYVFDLGLSSLVLDQNEGNSVSDGASQFVGLTFGSTADPLRDTLVRFSPVSVSGGDYDIDNGLLLPSGDTFSINGGASQTVDGFATYNATITYTDGTVLTTGTVQIMQSTSGQLYAVPSLTLQDLLAKPVASFTLGTVTDNGSLMAADRPVIGSGTSGADLLTGTTGNDYYDGYTGNDTLSGGDGNDTVMGGAGNDSLSGANGNDSLSGDAGNDTLDGGAGADTLLGGIGSDTLRGGDDADLITGDGTQDLLVNGGFEAGVAPSTVEWFGSVGGWTNGSGASLEIWGNGHNGEGNAVEGYNFLELDNAGSVDTVRQDVQTVSGESYTLSFSAQQRGTGTDSVEVWWRGTLIATVTPNAGWTTYTYVVTGSGGTDRLEFREPSSQNSGLGPLLDSVQLIGAAPGAAEDSLEGGAGSDTIRGGVGNDTIDGGTGNDSLLGEAGDDIFRLNSGTDGDTITGGETSEVNGDTLDASAMTQGIAVTFTGTESGSLGTGSFSQIERVFFGSGNDTVTGHSGADRIDGAAGNDLISGAAGNDTLFGNAGNDTVAGDDGDDRVTGGAGSDSLTGGAGNDTLTGGGSFSNTISSENFSTTTAGWVNATTGTAIVNTFGLNSGNVVLGRFAGNGTGAEQIRKTFDLTDNAPHALIGFDFVKLDSWDENNASGVNERLVVYIDGQAVFSFTPDGIDSGFGDGANVSGTFAGGSYTVTSSGADSALGGDGTFADRIYRVEIVLNNPNGTVTLGFGSTTNQADTDESFAIDNVSVVSTDTLGVDGADTLAGGAGNDVMSGGDGDDRFVLADGAGNDTITGGETSQTAGDVLDASAVTTGATVTLTGAETGTLATTNIATTFSEIERFILTAGADTLFGSTSADSVDGSGGADLLFGYAGADTLAGGAGNDTLHGGLGADSLDGGDGDDTFIVPGGDGSDTIAGGESGEAAGDLLDAGSLVGNATLNLSAPETGTLASGSDTISFSQIERITLGSGNDGVTGSSGADNIGAGGGTDTMTGGAGNDTLDGGAGNDTISGDADNDSLTGGMGNDSLSGGTGDDTLLGGASGPTNLVVNGSFENVAGLTTVSWGATGTGSIPGWTATNASFPLDVHNDQRGSVETADGANWLDLEAATGQNVRIGQNIEGLTSGQSLTLTFSAGDHGSYSGANENQINVYWGGTLIGTINPPQGTMQTYTFNLTAGSGNGSNRLEFENTGGAADANGASLDAVSLTAADVAGNDTLDGGAGNDVLSGGAGNDQLAGGLGNDSMTGGDGDDRFLLVDATGTDTVTGGEAAETNGDVLDASAVTTGATLTLGTAESGTLASTGISTSFSEIERFVLTAGADTLVGSTGNDSVDGGAGNDSLAGNAGNDTLAGAAGNDTLAGGAGNDNLSGGDGDDRFVLVDATGTDTIAGGETGETSGDILDASSVTTGTVLTLSAPETGTLTGTGIATTFSEIERFLLSQGADTADGSTGSDSIDGGGGNDRVSGGAGNDTLSGGDGNDDILGGDGADLLSGGTGNDDIGGGNGNDTIGGGDGDDWLYGDDVGESGSDVLFGGAGNDTLIGNALSDTLYGGTGDDYLYGGYLGQAGGDLLDGGTGVDTVDYTFSNDAIIVDLAAGTGSGGDAAGDTLVSIEAVFGSDFADTITGGTANEFLRGSLGNDSLLGGAGNDTLSGGTGNDTLSGDAGDDLVFGDDGDDWLTVGNSAGNDTLFGGASGQVNGDNLNAQSMTNAATLSFASGVSGTLQAAGTNLTFDEIERVYLGSNADTVDGTGSTSGIWVDAGAGNDTLTGSASADQMWGGIGNDTLRGGAGGDQLTGSDGDDTFILENGFGADTINGGFSGQVAGDVIDATAVTSALTVTLSSATAGTISDGSATASYSHIERLNLGSGADTVTGSASGDRIDTGAGNDTVNAGAGADSIAAGAGNDTVAGGDGNDTLAGGADNDSLTGDLGADILSGDDGDDRLDGGDGNDTLQGGAGRDRLAGGAGIDRLEGGTGADSFVVDGTADTIADFDATTGIGNGTSADNDFVDLTAVYNDTTLAAWNTANPSQTFGNALAWLQSDAQDGTLDQAGGLRIENGGTAVAAGSLIAENTGVVCFARGTAIRTARGEVRVEDLRAGDRVWTEDDGFQPIRWIGSSFVPAMDKNAPVVIEAGVMGNARPLRVSPQHRMLLEGAAVERHCGQASVFVPAKALVDGVTIRQEPALFAQYFHILLPRHAVILAEGVRTESFLPGPEGWKMMSRACRDGLAAVLPRLAAGDFGSYGGPARPVLTVGQARTLVALLQGVPVKPRHLQRLADRHDTRRAA